MKSTMRVFTIASLALLSVAAYAIDDFDFKVANIDVLQDKNVQKELGITDTERATLNVFATKYSKAGQEKLAEYQKAKKVPDMALNKFGRDQYIELRTNVLKTLTAPQLKRLREITIRAAGPRALMDKVVADKVGMTNDEYSKFMAAIQEGDNKIAKIKGEVSAKIREKYKNQKPPKTKAESDIFQKKVNTDLNTEMKKHQTEMATIISTSEKKTGGIVKKQYMVNLSALMGKPFVIKDATPPKAGAKPTAKPSGKKGG